MKQITLAIYEIMCHESDEEHPISRHKILELLEKRYNLEITRQTLKKHFNLLAEHGIEVEYDSIKKAYYLNSREFEKSEIHLLCNAVYSSHFIPESDSKKLIKKLLDTQSKYVSQSFNNNVYVKNERKSLNKQFFYNVETLLEAIQNKKAVSFLYMKYNHQKQLVLRRKERYLIHPYHIIYANENFYLICRNDHYDNLSHYRIDRMQDIQITDIVLKKLGKDFDPYEYAKTKMFMYGGDEEMISLLCDDVIFDDIIDRFGRDVMIQKAGHDHFQVYLKSSRQGILYFALQYAAHCQIMTPASLRNEMIQILQNTLEKYQSKR